MLSLLLACHGDPSKPGRPHETGTVDSGLPPPVTVTVDGLVLHIEPELPTVVFASFDDPGSADAWVEYRFETDDWRVAPLTAPGEATILGLPSGVEVEVQVVATVDGTSWRSPSAFVTTNPLPPGLLLPEVVSYDPALASPERYAMISLSTGRNRYEGPWYVVIFDRDGRIVWFRSIPAGLFTFQPRVALDGTHVWYEAENIFGFSDGQPTVTRQTLDGRWLKQLTVPDLGQAIAEGPDDRFYFEQRARYSNALAEIDADGAVTIDWDCGAYLDHAFGLEPDACSMNTCNWDPVRNSVLVSQFETSTVFEIDLATGEPVRQLGQLGGGYRFVPSDAGFAYQHDPYWTAQGTLMVSTHETCGSTPDCKSNFGVPGIQIAAEYTVDDVAQTLTRTWDHVSTDRWATQVGEAYRLPNGNFVQGYGQDGAVREITADDQIAWEVEWPKDDQGYRVVGHLTLIDDLYAINKGR